MTSRDNYPEKYCEVFAEGVAGINLDVTALDIVEEYLGDLLLYLGVAMKMNGAALHANDQLIASVLKCFRIVMTGLV